MSQRLLPMLVLAAGTLPSQQPPPASVTAVHKDYAELVQRLATGRGSTGAEATGDQAPGVRAPGVRAPSVRAPGGVQERLRLLRTFLHRHRYVRDRHAQSLLLKARLRLGRLLLVSFASSEAIEELQTVVDLATAPGHRDLRGRALYGIAQAQEMLGQIQACRTTLELLQNEFEDTRYGRIATIAARRLSKASRGARNGLAAPAFGPLLDVEGRLVSHGSLRLKPALLLFWSPDVESSRKRVDRLTRAWREAGGDPRQVVAFAVHPDRARVAAIAKEAGWGVSVVPCGSDFLDPVVLSYGVDGVPTSFLLGPDGTLLGRNHGVQEIVRLLQKLR